MTRLPRPCLICGQLTTNGARCRTCGNFRNRRGMDGDSNPKDTGQNYAGPSYPGQDFDSDKPLPEPDQMTEAVLQDTVLESDTPLETIAAGDTVHIEGSTGAGGSIEFNVTDTRRYESDAGNWGEFSGHYQGRPVHLEVFPGASVETGVVLGDQSFSLDEIP